MISILAYGCTSSAGEGVQPFWRGLAEGRDHSRAFNASCDAKNEMACLWADSSPALISAKEKIVTQMLSAWRELGVSAASLGSLGVIFASAKGSLEDFIWDPDETSLRRDPLTPCLESFLEKSGLAAQRWVSVSNACASSHSALFLAEKWLSQRLVSRVLVVAADVIGPFVVQGFRALGALSDTCNRPFSQRRDGLRLGEAAAAILLGPETSGKYRVNGVGLDTEGFAATRPSEAGESLKRAIQNAVEANRREPTLVVAHGTGTAANDKSEDHVLSELFAPETPWITATKWSIGHTLGASGAMDLIAACEALRRQEVFQIGNTDDIDPSFKGRYLYRGSSVTVALPIREALVTSLGFGGVHAAVRVGVDA